MEKNVQTYGSVCCYWILDAEKIPQIEIHSWVQAAYSEECVDMNTVRCLVRQLTYGEVEQAELSDK